MAEVFLLDTGPIGMLMHPRAHKDIKTWFERALTQGEDDPAAPYVLVPEIADYELRRQLLLKNFRASVRRLDKLKERIGYLSIDTDVMLQAAQLWADARQKDRPTADPYALDGDVILAAQAQGLTKLNMEPTVLTDNVGHLSRFVSTKRWPEVTGGLRAWHGVSFLLADSDESELDPSVS